MHRLVGIGVNCKVHEFSGSSVVGERGQIVIPQKAREKLEIYPGDKVLFFIAHGGKGLILLKAEHVSEIIAKTLENVSLLERISKTPPETEE